MMRRHCSGAARIRLSRLTFFCPFLQHTSSLRVGCVKVTNVNRRHYSCVPWRCGTRVAISRSINAAHTEKVGRVQACGREEEGLALAIGLNKGTKESAIAAGADLDKPPTDTDSMHA